MTAPLIALMLGDRNGVGPELVAKLLAEPAAHEETRLAVLGDPDVFAQGCKAAGVTPELRRAAQFGEAAAGRPVLVERRVAAGEAIGAGRADARAGAEVLDHLAFLVEAFGRGEIEGIVFAPLNKQAMRLGGLAAGDELDFIVERLGFTGNCGELNVLGGLWTSRVTSHVALRDVADLVTRERVLEAIRLAHATLSASGIAAPRLAVAGLNPHAGDGGVFGDEEGREIAPAVAAAKAEGIDASGPFPADTVFVAAKNGRYDAVVSMYHDQGQIAMKLMGFGRGVTVLGGLPVPIATCGHGTAYDIVGQGKARPDALKEALRLCRAMALARRKS